MKNNCKYYFLSLIVMAVIVNMGMQVPAFAGESATGKSDSMADGSMQEADSTDTESQVMCQEPRPQICTRDYRPVCAQMKDGSLKTYSNGCTSCSDSNAVGYRTGECESVNADGQAMPGRR